MVRASATGTILVALPSAEPCGPSVSPTLALPFALLIASLRSFVRYNTPSAAQKCIDAMNGLRVANKRLLCKLANQSSSTSYNSEYGKNPILSSQVQSDNLYIKPLLPNTSEGAFAAPSNFPVLLFPFPGRPLASSSYSSRPTFACFVIDESFIFVLHYYWDL